MTNESPFDRWSWVHGLNGLGLGLVGASAPLTFGAAAVYELGEYYHERHGSAIFGTKAPESAANIVTDTAVYGGAYWVGRQIRQHDIAGTLGLLSFVGAAFVTWYISPLRKTGREQNTVSLTA